MRKILNDKNQALEEKVKCTWRIAMYDVVYGYVDPINSEQISKLDILWHEIDKEAMTWKKDDLWELYDCILNDLLTKCRHNEKALLESFEEKLSLDNKEVCTNRKMVNEFFEEVKKIKDSKQVDEHIKSEKDDKNKHDKDKKILAQAFTYKKLVNSKYKIYIASYDMRFFSPLLKKNWEGKTEVEDDIITQRIQKKFKITCNSPEKILEILDSPLEN